MNALVTEMVAQAQLSKNLLVARRQKVLERSKNLLVDRRQKVLGAKVVAAALKHQAVALDKSKVMVDDWFQAWKATEMVLLVPTL